MSKVSKLLSEYPPAPSSEEVQQELTALLQNVSKYDSLENMKKIFSLIDLTSLNSFDQKARIEQMADQVNNFKSIKLFFSIFFFFSFNNFQYNFILIFHIWFR